MNKEKQSLYKFLCCKNKEDKENSIILANDVYMSLDDKVHKRNLNQLILGSAGTGKTRQFIEPNILQANTSFVINDCCNFLMHKYRDFLISKGYKIKYINIDDMKQSMKYNPFSYILKNTDVYKVVSYILDSMKKYQEENNENFYTFESILLNAIIFYFYENKTKEEFNFKNIKEILNVYNSNPGNFLEYFDNLFFALDDNSFAYKEYKKFKEVCLKDFINDIFMSLYHKLLIFDNEDFENLTIYDELELEKLGQEKTALFIITSKSESTYNFIYSMLISQILDISMEVAEQHNNPIHLRLFLDEFHNYGKLSNLKNILPRMYKRNISITFIVQILSQLKKVCQLHSMEIGEIIGNCDTLIFTGGFNDENNKFIHECMTKNIVEYNCNKIKVNNFLFFKRKKIINFNMSVTALSLMKIEEVIIIVRDLDPILVNKYKLETHPNYKNCKEL